MQSRLQRLNMSYSDSKAVFKKRFLEIGLTDANYEAFNAEGLNTLGTFAFACNYAPGAADERPLVTLATRFRKFTYNERDGLHTEVVQ